MSKYLEYSCQLLLGQTVSTLRIGFRYAAWFIRPDALAGLCSDTKCSGTSLVMALEYHASG